MKFEMNLKTLKHIYIYIYIHIFIYTEELQKTKMFETPSFGGCYITKAPALVDPHKVVVLHAKQWQHSLPSDVTNPWIPTLERQLDQKEMMAQSSKVLIHLQNARVVNPGHPPDPRDPRHPRDPRDSRDPRHRPPFPRASLEV